jgi:hypothetical protein
MNNVQKILISTLSTILIIGVSACAAAAAPATDTAISEATTSVSNDYGNGNSTMSLNIAATALSQEETEALLFMREEEKLARDVYNALYDLWGQRIFQNIAASEQKHMDSIMLLLERYDLKDPALEPGSFSDPELGALYDQLVAQGSTSLADALKVGAAIEEIDILDLEERLTKIDNEDIQLVFKNLMKGSYNHLNAFTRVYSNQVGEAYQPQYLTSEAYAAIITGQAGNGFGNGRQVGGPGRGGFRSGRNGFNNQSQ